MTSALAFLLWRSAWNATRVRLSRLKQIRYALATAFGLSYFYWLFGRNAAQGIDRLGISREMVEMVMPLALFGMVAWPWMTPRTPTAAISFTPAEVNLLFPAPLRRAQLIGYQIARAHVSTLAGTAIFALISGRHRPASFSMTVFGLWMAFTVIELHEMGVSLLRAGGERRDIRALLLRWTPVLILGVIAAALLVRIAAAIVPHLWSLPSLASLPDAFPEIRSSMAGLFDGWLGLAMWPFRALVRLPAAPTATGFLAALPGVLALWALCVGWVLLSAAAFEEASAAEAEYHSRLMEKPGAAPAQKRRHGPLFTLAPTGRVETALLWKNLIARGRVSGTFIVSMLVLLGTLAATLTLRSGSVAAGPVIAFTLVILAALTAITGPVHMRFDLRQDLARLATLKSWPVSGAALVRGEVLAPIAVLTVTIALSLIAAAALGGPALAASRNVSGMTVAAWCVSAILLASGVAAVGVIAQNGLAVLFPAWVPFGPRSTAGGMTGSGQVMVFTVGSMLLIPVAVIPAALVGLVLWGLMAWIFGAVHVLIPAMAATITLAVECWVAAEAIGAVLDRTDISAIDPA